MILGNEINFGYEACIADFSYPIESRLLERYVKLDENNPLHEVTTMLLGDKINRET